MVIVAALAPLVAWFYDEPALFAVTLVVAATFIFSGLAVQHMALLKRQMRFTALAVQGVLATAVGVTLAITLAWLGAGYWALVAMPAASALVTMILAWAFARWLPGPPRRGAGVRAMLAFGGNLTGFQFVNYFARQGDDILVGFLFGATSLGQYTVAYRLLMLPIQFVNRPISAVAIPALSRLQTTPRSYRAYYRLGIRLLASLSLPVVVVIVLNVENLIVLTLGEKWLGAVPIFWGMAPLAILGSINVVPGWAFVTLGRTGTQFQWALIRTPFIILAFVVGSQFGVVGVAVGASVGLCAGWIGGVFFAFRNTFLNGSDLVAALWRPAAASLAATAITLIAARWYADQHAFTEVATRTLVFGISYSSFWLSLPGGISDFRNVAIGFFARTFPREQNRKEMC